MSVYLDQRFEKKSHGKIIFLSGHIEKLVYLRKMTKRRITRK